MHRSKVKSFTLSEMLVVMIITAIVVGIAFSVLNLVQKQVRSIKKNFDRTTELSLFEERLWQDFNLHSVIIFSGEELILRSDVDTVVYHFNEKVILRNTDTVHAAVTIGKLYYEGKQVKSGYVDALSISADAELPGYSIFVSTTPDAAHYMNEDGL
jgi:hypothetical protein